MTQFGTNVGFGFVVRCKFGTTSETESVLKLGEGGAWV